MARRELYEMKLKRCLRRRTVAFHQSVSESHLGEPCFEQENTQSDDT